MNTNDLFKAVMQLDLEPIKMKLMHAASGEGWSLEKANAVEKEYRRFLCLMKMYPDEDTAPLVDVDTFWHYHILDTMKYAADCEQAFGYFLHHYPYVGMGGEDDEQFRLDSGDRMRELYEATFGETYPGAAAATERTQADTAFCASPHVTATAFCASPHGKDIAFCASPHTRRGTTLRAADIQTDTAFCASPHGKDIAFCASPHGKDTAFCASPHVTGKAIANA
ncbi:hypothetical protein SAMN05428966_102280 [Massilia sp. PDC64]|nr:hypothetical protein [Massilia sp. PDC64]SDC76155.1 hypothetical protein SAMN05428966_102280 [Massilia sp. PDC64]